MAAASWRFRATSSTMRTLASMEPLQGPGDFPAAAAGRPSSEPGLLAPNPLQRADQVVPAGLGSDRVDVAVQTLAVSASQVFGGEDQDRDVARHRVLA